MLTDTFSDSSGGQDRLQSSNITDDKVNVRKRSLVLLNARTEQQLSSSIILHQISRRNGLRRKYTPCHKCMFEYLNCMMPKRGFLSIGMVVSVSGYTPSVHSASQRPLSCLTNDRDTYYCTPWTGLALDTI